MKAISFPIAIFRLLPGRISPHTARNMSLKRKAADLAAEDAKKPKANGNIKAFFGVPKPAPAKNGGASGSNAGNTSNKSNNSSSSNSNSNSTSISAGLNGNGVSTPTKKFDKDAWVAKLSEEQKGLLQLEINTMHESWLAVLKDELVTAEFLSLKRFLKREVEAGKTVFPPSQDVYSWSRHTPLDTVKVVILGQDPYHNHNQAHGLCFSVRPPTPAPPSLKNMYIALKKDYPTFSPPPKNSGLLTPWADRGVLLLNTCLTVRAHEANSHSGKGWERLTQKAIEAVAKTRQNGVVFLAWGNPAQKRVTGINSRHLVLKSVHPSPLSASRGFFDCGHFKETNKWLKQRYGEDGVIDWDLNVPPEKAGV